MCRLNITTTVLPQITHEGLNAMKKKNKPKKTFLHVCF